ncbi:VOC family protein [Chitinophaga tropicalis]|uniref:Glyoxalase n=1 Tax=Chitinophaga tropicalis TaxID=2683588 RepID=A0A7K1TXC0_9BACT|nr:hypothetical protein [Chitinophaga tropicalis]MVT06733.1 hypothetical protein [Chitinophaga tropicalis]
MDNIKNQREWLPVPVLHCVSLEDTLRFWTSLGFDITYKQTRPYGYAVVERGAYGLHFHQLKGMDASKNFYGGCLMMVSDAEEVYKDFAAQIKSTLGKVPHSGIPRISRMKPGTTRFTLTDVSGNSVIFISYGEQDSETWEKADDKDQSPLRKAIATAVRFRDYKNDDMAAARTLDAALKRNGAESQEDVAEALILRIELARAMGNVQQQELYTERLNALGLSHEVVDRLKLKHITLQ